VGAANSRHCASTSSTSALRASFAAVTGRRCQPKFHTHSYRAHFQHFRSLVPLGRTIQGCEILKAQVHIGVIGADILFSNLQRLLGDHYRAVILAGPV
jgi:hypothetical protein